MADESFVLRGINWREVFPFTHLFRAFRISIHPSKLVLALACLLLIYAGGRFLDGVWPDKYSVPARQTTVMPQWLPNGIHLDMAKFDAPSSVNKVGPFVGFMDRESTLINNITTGVLTWTWYDGVVLGLLALLIQVPLATFLANPFFFILFWIWALLVWSVFGGAIARIAAVHVARDEKLSVRHALRFSTGKVLSFIFAPIIPLLIILAIGLALAIGGLQLYIPYVGPIAVGILYFIGIAAGFVMSLVLIGTIGGITLMYPTIAVEGSDSFDAISRSFSYIYARPWRVIWYGLVALVYGALTYLFVRLFVFFLLGLSHYFIAWFLTDYGQGRWQAMWPSPTLYPFPMGSLSYSVNFDALNWGEAIGAGVLSFWVYLVIGLLGAYIISYYFSANTIVYYLLRRNVDATEMDDVYLEEIDEDFGDTLPAATAAGEAAPITVTESTSVVVTQTSTEKSTENAEKPSMEDEAAKSGEPGKPHEGEGSTGH